ncbi:MAG: hypothetical protein EOO45_25020 [Flavobacterium sp.]|nr:MAG: hypothetical protein EOO45_25020 [Flavobacterium sp.]
MLCPPLEWVGGGKSIFIPALKDRAMNNFPNRHFEPQGEIPVFVAPTIFNQFRYCLPVVGRRTEA